MATAGPAPTHTREPIAPLACVERATRIRRGPGTNYETIGGLPSGTCLTILGRNEDASWVYIISDDDLTGWIAATTLTELGDIGRVSVRDDAAMVNSTRPTLTSAEIANGAGLFLTRVAATNQAQAPLIEYVEPCFEAVNEIGEQISCKLEKAYCDYLPEEEGSPTVCIDRPAPDHTFALVVFGQDWSEYDGQCLIVSGYLEVNWGMLQIQALRRSQVSACE
jgi:Bacterial SH3 domain